MLAWIRPRAGNTFWFLAGSVGVIVLGGAAKAFFDLDLTQDGMIDLVAKAFTGVATWSEGYIRIHPLRVYAAAALLPVALAVAWWAIKLRRNVRWVLSVAKTTIKKSKLLDRIGIYGHWLHNTNDLRKNNWSDLKRRVALPQNNMLWIMGATGWNTFASKDSPLRETIENFNGQIRILLLSPEGCACRQRSTSVSQKLSAYQSEIKRTLKFCERLAAEGKTVEVRLYDWPPTWKVILTTTSFWLQHYEQRRHVEDGPVITGYVTQEGSDFYGGFYAFFDRMFATAQPVPLSSGTTTVPELANVGA